MSETNASNSVVEAIGLTKIFKDFWGRPKARAVNGIDFRIPRGQVFGLLGPNGSGKSTTVKMILGLLYPTRGTLRVFGETPENVDMKSRVGYLPEETYLYKYLTAEETLDFFGALFGLSPEERRNRGTQLLEMVGLANSYNRPVGEFSKGMARRIGLAQALVNDPDLVILDEPTSGLDPIGCREVKDVIRLLAQRGKTVILCSHLLADVQDVCDEVVVLYGGRIRTQGALADILKVEDKTRVVMPRLSEAGVKEMVGLLGKYVDIDAIRVDHPSMNLEDFFLDVVRQARDASLETAGASSGGAIAPYLQGTDEEASGKRVLEELIAAAAPVPPAPPEPEEPVPAPTSEKLLELARTEPAAAPAQESTAPVPEKSAVVDEKANERLQKLLGDQQTKR